MGAGFKNEEEIMIKKNVCSVCGAILIQKKIEYSQNFEGRVYFVTDVPAQVCQQCGEQYLSPETVDILQEIIEQGPKKGLQTQIMSVPVYHFPLA